MADLQSESSDSDHASDECNELMPMPEDFNWNVTQRIALLNSMINLKPAGVHKHLNMLLIREEVSKNLKMNIPTSAIWKFLHSCWDTDIADKLEGTAVTFEKKNFDLPNDEEWSKLIKEEIANLNKSKDAVGDETVDKDSKLLKSVKVMVEKLDSPNSLINCLKSNNVVNWEKTLKNSPDDFHPEGTTSNLNNLKSDNDLGEYTVEIESTGVQKRSISPDKHLKNENKRLIGVSDTCSLKTPILAGSTSTSHTLTYNSDTEINSDKSDSVNKEKN